MLAWLEVEGVSPRAATPQPVGSFADEMVIGADLQPIKRPVTAERNPAAHLLSRPPVCQLAVAERAASLKKQRCALGCCLDEMGPSECVAMSQTLLFARRRVYLPGQPGQLARFLLRDMMGVLHHSTPIISAAGRE